MIKYVNVKASEEAAYTVNAYYDERGRGLSKSADCNDYDKAVELAHEFIGDGGSVEIVNNETGAYKLYTYDEYFEDFEGDSPFSYVSDVLASTRKIKASDNYSNEANINRRKIMVLLRMMERFLGLLIRKMIRILMVAMNRLWNYF